MDAPRYTSGDLVKLYQYNGSRQAIVAAENKGSIPKADRGNRRSTSTRTWTTEQLPDIGKHFGQFKQLADPSVITVSNFKGGVLKSGVVAGLARYFSISGLRCVVLGCDEQQSISLSLLNPLAKLKDLSEWEIPLTVADYINGVPLSEILLDTDIPTLKIIPESHALAELNSQLASKTMRHKSLSKLMKELKKSFDLIIADTSPSFSPLTECCLFEANLHIVPVAAEVGCYSVMSHNDALIEDWYDLIGEAPPKKLIVPTLTATNKVSKQIVAAYMQNYPNNVSVASIPRTVKGAEAESLGLSSIEHAPSSPIAEAYRSLAVEVFQLIGGELHGT